MKKTISTLLICLLILFNISSIFTLQITAQTNTILLTDATPVKIRLNRTISSADAKVGESVDFDVMEDVRVGDVIVIPRGSIATAAVTQAKPRGRMGKGGKLDIAIDSIRLSSGEKIPLRATKETSGSGNAGVMTGAIVASAILFWPAAPVFLLMKGKDITITKGTEITAYVAGDINLDLKKLSGGQGANQSPSSVETPATAELSISVKSNPDGADIMIDGKFVGNTPSNVKLKTGDHTISIKKKGFVLWERSVTLAAGSEISINADLEKSPN